MNNPICIVNEVKTLVLILLMLLKIQEEYRDCLQNIASKMFGYVCLLLPRNNLFRSDLQLSLSSLFYSSWKVIVYKCPNEKSGLYLYQLPV